MNASARRLGRTEPRLLTEPLRDLTEPGATLGPAVAAFADMIGQPLLPWQRWLVDHALELRPDGSFRFSTIVVTVGRQSGKSHVLRMISLTLMYLGYASLVLGAAQSLDIARDQWRSAVTTATTEPALADDVHTVRYGAGDQLLQLANGSRYRITAASANAGRGLSVDLLVLDELRTYRDWAAWSALSKTTNARPNALTFAVSNAGDDSSVVLNSLRDIALAGSNDRIAIFEWSTPMDMAIDDPDGWAYACPALGYLVAEESIALSLATDPAAVFRTEQLNQRVQSLNGAIDLTHWGNGADVGLTMDSLRDRVAVALDVAPDGHHASLVAAAVRDNGTVQVEVVAAFDSLAQVRAELPGLLADVGAKSFGYFAAGPAASLATELRAFGAVEIRGAQVMEVCQEFAEMVTSRLLAHPGDPLLTSQVAASTRLYSGDGWRFSRPRGAGYVDAVYAAAGATHLARNLPRSVGAPRLLFAD